MNPPFNFWKKENFGWDPFGPFLLGVDIFTDLQDIEYYDYDYDYDGQVLVNPSLVISVSESAS